MCYNRRCVFLRFDHNTQPRYHAHKLGAAMMTLETANKILERLGLEVRAKPGDFTHTVGDDIMVSILDRMDAMQERIDVLEAHNDLNEGT